MKSPRPCSYHQNDTAVAISSASSALAMRLRSSVRWATRVIVASGSRGARRRRGLGGRAPSLTVVLPGRRRSAGAVGRAGLLGAGPQLGGTRLGSAGLLVQLGGQVTVGGRGRGGGGGELAADRGLRGVLGANGRAGV